MYNEHLSPNRFMSIYEQKETDKLTKEKADGIIKK